MKAWYQNNHIWQEADTLLEALGWKDFTQGRIAVVGAGGKTSTIFRLAKEFAAGNRRVVITTTTHMLRELGVLATTVEEVRELLLQQPIVIAGRTAKDGKIASLEAAEIMALSHIADMVLIEADGSKHLPLKVPAAQEPVIPVGTDRVLVVAGLSGMGGILSECCHRAELVQALLQVTPEHRIGPEDVALMIQKGYLEKHLLPNGYQGIVILNQAEGGKKEAGRKIAELLAPYPCVMTQLKEE
ncbi:MAG: hypothetical protein K0R46_1774 [Herbinix sp.]|jgi:probable selenium-dependent hydroxylase accessory protein YqeC|nr:hypothetical protein [Herbinix sp.]